jgi:hypothetical protein
MSTVAFLASVVDPRVASAAAKAALGKSHTMIYVGIHVEQKSSYFSHEENICHNLRMSSAKYETNLFPCL